MMLLGKRVLITGGGSGVGADMARSFAGAGAEVVVTGRRAAPLDALAQANPSIRAVVADITQEADVKAMFEQAGACDIVVANAGAADSGLLAKTTLDQWNAMLAVNLTGVFLTLREGVRQMPGWGRLISVASVAGLKGFAYAAPYAAAKHGVIGLTRSLALEVAKRPITVNAICPGYLDTDMTARSIANIIAKTGKSSAEAQAILTASNPQGRLIRADEVTATALWLCSPGAESVNGQSIALSGGEV